MAQMNCHDCYLCGKNDTYMTHFYNWGSPEQSFVKHHLDKSPPSCAQICKKHLVEAQ